jgi:hypothetical protein
MCVLRAPGGAYCRAPDDRLCRCAPPPLCYPAYRRRRKLPRGTGGGRAERAPTLRALHKNGARHVQTHWWVALSHHTFVAAQLPWEDGGGRGSAQWWGRVAMRAARHPRIAHATPCPLRAGGKMPLIGCGGVSSGEDAYKKIRAGESLLLSRSGRLADAHTGRPVNRSSHSPPHLRQARAWCRCTRRSRTPGPRRCQTSRSSWRLASRETATQASARPLGQTTARAGANKQTGPTLLVE